MQKRFTDCAKKNIHNNITKQKRNSCDKNISKCKITEILIIVIIIAIRLIIIIMRVLMIEIVIIMIMEVLVTIAIIIMIVKMIVYRGNSMENEKNRMLWWNKKPER